MSRSIGLLCLGTTGLLLVFTQPPIANGQASKDSTQRFDPQVNVARLLAQADAGIFVISVFCSMLVSTLMYGTSRP